MRHLVCFTLLISVVSIINSAAPSLAQNVSIADKPPVQADDQNKDSSPANAKEEEKKPTKKLETVEVVNQPLRVFKTLKGLLESAAATEIKTDFQTWKDLKIKTVAKQGKVAQGDTLVQLDTESIDKAITEAEFQLGSAKFSQQLMSLEAKRSAETFELEKAIAKLSWQSAQEDHKYYKETTIPRREKNQKYEEKKAGYHLEYSKDELDQLTEMYTEDELTEESEAIVLKRAQRTVESAEFSLDNSLLRLKRIRKLENPRSDQRHEQSFAKSRMEFQKSEVALPIEKEKSKISLAKADFQLSQKEKALKELVEDRTKMTIKSEIGGILFYGECDRGKWSGERDLKRDSKLPAKAVVMTVVDTSQMIIQASVAEANLSSFTAGLSGKAKFDATDDKIVPCTIDSIERIPLKAGKYDCKVTLQNIPTDANLIPGMGCTMSFLTYVNNNALVVPKASVFSDDDGFTHYVYLSAEEESKPRKVDVVTGKTAGNKTEILSGLSAGDKIAKKKP